MPIGTMEPSFSPDGFSYCRAPYFR